MRSFPVTLSGCLSSPHIREVAESFTSGGVTISNQAQAGVAAKKVASPPYPAAPLPRPLQMGSLHVHLLPALAPPTPCSTWPAAQRAVEKLALSLFPGGPGNCL
jgi:hypothetical protein